MQRTSTCGMREAEQTCMTGLDLEVSERNGSEWLFHSQQAKWSCPSRLVVGKELARGVA